MKSKSIFLLFSLFVINSSMAFSGNGEALYQRHCAACHGIAGDGGVGSSLAAAEFLEVVPQDYITKTIILGRPGKVMPAFSRLEDHEIQAITQHILGWYNGARIDLSHDLIVGDEQHGKHLFDQYCAECHGANGNGGRGAGVRFSHEQGQAPLPPALTNSGYLNAASDQFIRISILRKHKDFFVHSDSKQRINDRNINDIVVYLRGFGKNYDPLINSSDDDQSPILSYTSSNSYSDTIEMVKQAVEGANFRLIRIQHIDNGLVEQDKEDKDKTSIYFCNFNTVNELLKIDPRIGVFLPCRITVIRDQDGVKVYAVNPKILSQKLINNAELTKKCEQILAVYKSIIGDSVL